MADADEKDEDEELLKPGEVLDDRYRIDKELGRGGIGAVYKAEDLENHIPVAIKTLLDRWAKDSKMRARFLREGRLSIRARHPNIVQIYAIARRKSSGAPYIVMEFIEGDTLLDRIKKGKLGLECMHLMRQLASVLAACHARGIVHRDLKPANIMIVRDEEVIGGERIKLVDFGIAKMFTEEDDGTQTSMGDHQPGTPAYMAPEQCGGPLDKSADPAKMDCYAYGVILFQALAGKLPLWSPNRMGMMALAMSKEPESLLKIDPAIPPDLAQLVQELLAKDPQQRPTMEQVRERLKSRREVVSIRPTMEIDALAPAPVSESPSGAQTADASGGGAGPVAATTPPAAPNKSVGERSTQPQAPEAADGMLSSAARGTGQQVTSADTQARRRRTRRLFWVGGGLAVLTAGIFIASEFRHSVAPHSTPLTPAAISTGKSVEPRATPPPSVPAAPAPAEPPPAAEEALSAAVPSSRGHTAKSRPSCSPVLPTAACLSGAIAEGDKAAFVSALDEADIRLCPNDFLTVVSTPVPTVKTASGVRKNKQQRLELALRGALKKIVFPGQVTVQCKR